MPDETIDIRGYIDALRRWWWLLILGPILTGSVALGIGLLPSQPPVITGPVTTSGMYEASTIVAMEGTSILAGVSELVTTRPILQDAIKDAGLPLTVAELRSALSAIRLSDSSLIRLTVVDSDPDRAVDLADAVAQSLVDHVIALQKAQIALSQEELSQAFITLDLDSAGSAALADAMARMNGISKQPVVVTPAEVMNNLNLVEAPPDPLNNTIRNIVLGIFLGGVLSVISVIGLEYLQNPVGSPARLEAKFGLTRLGTLPRWRKFRNQHKPLLVADESSPVLMETTRQLATSVGLTIEEQIINTLAIVSPDVGDGRSSLASNLAIALADTWKDVVLVDADLRCPSLHRQFNVDNAVGLSDFLADPNLAVGSIIQQTAHKRLKVIPSGSIPENPVELLSSPRMRWLLGHLKETTDVVLVDTPPLLMATDGILVGSQVEGIVLVVNGRNCRVGTLKTAMVNLERAGTPILGYVWVGSSAGLLGNYSKSKRYHRRSGNGLQGKETPGEEKLKVDLQSHSNGTEVSQAHSPAS